jgi:hypothetical protein
MPRLLEDIDLRDRSRALANMRVLNSNLPEGVQRRINLLLASVADPDGAVRYLPRLLEQQRGHSIVWRGGRRWPTARGASRLRSPVHRAIPAAAGSLRREKRLCENTVTMRNAGEPFEPPTRPQCTSSQRERVAGPGRVRIVTQGKARRGLRSGGCDPPGPQNRRARATRRAAAHIEVRDSSGVYDFCI